MFRTTHRSSSGAQKTLITASGFTYALRRSKHVEQLINVGIINSNTWSHLVGYL